MSFAITYKEDGDPIKYDNFTTQIKSLENYNYITGLYCSSTALSDSIKLNHLPALPENLRELHCMYNGLLSLPPLPENLRVLYCFSNYIEEIPDLPESLEYLWCSCNRLKRLPKLHEGLKEFYCDNNKLSFLPLLPYSLKFHCYVANPIGDYIDKNFESDWKKYRDYQHKNYKNSIDKISEWFLECKYNPKYLYCRKRLIKQYNDLYYDL